MPHLSHSPSAILIATTLYTSAHITFSLACATTRLDIAKMELKACKLPDTMTTLPAPERQPCVREMEMPTSAAAWARESLMPSPTCRCLELVNGRKGCHTITTRWSRRWRFLMCSILSVGRAHDPRTGMFRVDEMREASVAVSPVNWCLMSVVLAIRLL